MIALPHSIRSQRLDIHVASEALALALQQRLGDLNRARLVPVIERVLDEFDVPGRHLRLDRLVIDLGVLPLAGLEEAAEAVLYDALRQSLRDAIGGAESADRTRDEGQSWAGSLADIFDHYLQFGTLPFWAASAGISGDDFSADGLVQTLAADQPAVLAPLIRRRGRDPHVLRRLVLQLDDEALHSFLRLLEPAHAALIVAYMLDLRQIHRTEPVVMLDDTAFRHVLWQLALAYLLRDAGSQFNRKSFVRALLEDMARGEGIDYDELVATLADGLRATLRHTSLASSLPAVIGEIVRDLGGSDASPESETEHSNDIPADISSNSDTELLLGLIRQHAGDRNALERLVLRLDETILQAVLRRLEPMHAAIVIAYLIELRRIHRVKPLLRLGEATFARLLWTLTFSYLVQERGSQFNRKSFVRSLLDNMAQSENLDYGALVATLADGLQATAAHHPHASSLPAVIGEIVDDLRGVEPGSPSDADADILTAFADTDPEALAALIRRYGGDRHETERLVARLDETTLQAVLRLLEPVHATLLIAYLLDLRQVHRSTPLLDLGAEAFRRLLWLLALSYVARDAGSQFNRKSFVRGLLTGLAQRETLNYDILLRELADGLRVTAGHQPVTSSLPAVIEELIEEAADETVRESADAPALPDGSAPVIDRYVRLDALRHYLHHGVLPIDVLLRRLNISVDALLLDLPSLGIAQLRALFAATSPEVRWPMLLRAVRSLSADRLAELVSRLLPPGLTSDSPMRRALVDAIGSASQGDVFHAHLVAALLDGEAIDLDAMMAAGPPAPSSTDDDIAAWPAAKLSAELLAAWRAGDASNSDGRQMFDVLLTRHPAEARSLFRAMAGAPDRDVMMARLPVGLFGRVLEVARPAEAPALAFLLDAIAAWPMSERPASDTVLRGVMLTEVLRIGSGAGGPLMQRVLRTMFGGTPTASVRRRLIETAGQAGLPAMTHALLVEALSAADDTTETGRETERHPRDLRDALFAWLGGDNAEHASDIPSDVLLAAMPDIIAAFAADVRNFLVQHAAKPERRARWIRMLPEAALARLIHVLEPRLFRSLIDDAELLHAAAGLTAAARQTPRVPRTAMWEGLLDYLAAVPAAERATEGFVDHVLARAAPDREALRRTAADLARSAGRPHLVAALLREHRPPSPRRDSPMSEPREHPLARRVRGKTAFGMDEPREEARDPVYIDNAGLVLAGPFLPHLFGSLDMLARDETSRLRLRDHDTASRAVHLLQYLVDGNCSRPEPLLVLNKIMCGMVSGMPVARVIEPTDRERELCDALLKAMIAQWTMIKESSVAALRETFLQRKGRLARKDGSWELRVERKSVDVLVDHVPWSFSVVYNAWMPHPLHVSW